MTSILTGNIVAKKQSKPRAGKGEPKPVRETRNKHNDPRESFHLPVLLQAALECSAALPDVPSNKSFVLRVALEKLMREQGLFPPTEDQLRQLLTKVPFDKLSPQLQAHLKKAGIGSPA